MKLLMQASSRSIDIIRFTLIRVLGLVELVLLIRILFKFFLANPQTVVVNEIYRITDILVYPFKLIFPDFHIGIHPFETMTIVAMIGYGLAVYVIFGLFEHIHKSH